jgi:hypothetical protein
MCKPSNNSIYAECRDRIFAETGLRRVSNKEMRVIIRERGGCLCNGKATGDRRFDNPRDSVV